MTKEHCLYSRRNDQSISFIGFWVDNLYLLTSGQRDMKGFKDQIQSEFEATYKGIPMFMLGIEFEVNLKKNLSTYHKSNIYTRFLTVSKLMKNRQKYP